jgi:hypothetical protein
MRQRMLPFRSHERAVVELDLGWFDLDTAHVCRTLSRDVSFGSVGRTQRGENERKGQMGSS